MKSITDLPDQDLYPIIFRNLSIQDLFNCRLVNKQFKYFSDHTNGLNSLIIGEPYLEIYDDYYWYYNNKLLDVNEIISLKCFRSIKLLSIFNLDKYLKYLKIYDQQLKLNELSNLINLESLEFGRHYVNFNRQIMNLNNLKVFASDNLNVKLNLPKLNQIKFNNMNQIQLNSNPESIIHLIAKNYQNEFEIFKNLEIMEIRNTDQLVNENLLIIFENLKQLKINFNLISSYSKDVIKNSLVKILNDKVKLRRKIDIYLEGFKIENIGKFNELESNLSTLWRFRLNNYDLLDLNLPFIDLLNYDDLEECVNNLKNDLPSTFFDKFQNIHHIAVVFCKDIDSLNWFLNNLKYLVELNIDCDSLDEVFYNNLPDTIRILDIHNKEDIDYDFILKLSKLRYFSTNIGKDLFDLAITSFSKLKNLLNFRFYFKREIQITKYDEFFYLNQEKLDYNQLVAKYNLIRFK